MKEKGFFTKWISLIVLFSLLGLAPFAPIASGEEEKQKKDLPPRAIVISPEYTGVVVPEGDDASIDLTVANRGQSDENITLKLTTVPKGWKAWVQTYSFTVKGIHVDSDESKSLTIKAEPDKNVGPGDYSFVVQGQSEDGQLTSKGNFTITVEEKKKKKKARGVKVITSYPVLRGPTDAKFEFSIEVESKIDKDTIFNLSAQGPENWTINFKPAYEDKFISSLRIKGNQSQTMAVEVKPYPLAEAGSYPIKVKVNSPTAQAEVDLTVVLTGTYKIEAGTANGLLSLNAFQGKPANISFYIKNTGSASHETVRFLSFKPENWKVKFNPEKIDGLGPDQLKQVEVTITPAEQALVGDYSVSLSIEGEKVNKNMELRVTVRASTAWGWVGIGIIVLVIAGLVTLFIRLGRR
ncbi:NEW3 domain-containing protein [Thermodesulfobacteriota bacterium]